jgi:hypothetical protein
MLNDDCLNVRLDDYFHQRRETASDMQTNDAEPDDSAAPDGAVEQGQSSRFATNTWRLRLGCVRLSRWARVVMRVIHQCHAAAGEDALVGLPAPYLRP